MSSQRAASRFVALLPAFLIASLFLGAQEGRAQSAGQSLWSDPATWPNRKVPVAGDKVVIADPVAHWPDQKVVEIVRKAG